VFARLLGLAPRGEGREPPVGAVAGQRGQLALAREPVEKIRLGEEDERSKALVAGVNGAVAPRVHADRGIGGREGEEARGVVAAEEEGIAVERQGDRAQLRRLSSDCSRVSSRRAIS
jgi:hypothetical protein